MAREKKEEVKKGAPEWLATYGDMMTLVLCFFVLLFSFSSIDAEKFKQLAASLSANNSILSGGAGSQSLELTPAAGNGIVQLPDAGRKSSNDVDTEKIKQSQKELQAMASDFKTYFAENNLIGRIDVDEEVEAIKLNFKDSVLFDKGKAVLKPEALDILDHIAEQLLKYTDNDMKIEGHTDTDPINTIQFPSNWELSSARAVAVLRFFVEEEGFAPTRISAEGFGEHRPIAPNDIEENKTKNRRVEIKILSKNYSNGEVQ